MNMKAVTPGFKKLLDSLTADQRLAVDKHAAELEKNLDVIHAAEILQKSRSLEDTKFVAQLGWATALAAIIAIIAVEVT